MLDSWHKQIIHQLLEYTRLNIIWLSRIFQNTPNINIFDPKITPIINQNHVLDMKLKWDRDEHLHTKEIIFV